MTKKTEKKSYLLSRLRTLGAFKSRESRKGSTRYDPYEKFEVVQRLLEPEVARVLYEQFWPARNIVDVLAEDMTRRWITLEGDPHTKDIAEAELKRLNAQSAFHDLIRHELITGDGIIIIGADDGQSPDQPLRAGPVKVRFLHVLGRDGIEDIDIDDDALSPQYGKAKRFILKGKKVVHASRVLHLQTRTLTNEKWGASIFLPLLQIFLVMDNAEWSVGQILYSLIFKVVKTKTLFHSQAQDENLDAEIAKELNALSAVIVGPDEDVEFRSPTGSLGSVGDLLEYIFNSYSAAARIPKTRLIGAGVGTLSGAEFDTRSYYDRINGMQEAYLRELIQRLLDLIAPGVSFTFNSLLTEDEQRKASTFKDKVAAIVELVNIGAITIEEARGMLGLSSESPLAAIAVTK